MSYCTGSFDMSSLCLCVQEEQGLDLQSLNLDSLEQLRYTDCVIKETLRINPPVPGGFRIALKTFTLNVRKNTLVNLHFFFC